MLTAPPPAIVESHRVTQSVSARYDRRFATADVSVRSSELERQFASAILLASAPHWDGPGSAPVSDLTMGRALAFLEALPSTFPPPEISADPDGEIAFEWYGGRGLVFSVSVGERLGVAYAGTIGALRLWGTEPFFDEIPSGVLEMLRRLYRAAARR
jgi:hypothetical protein